MYVFLDGSPERMNDPSPLTVQNAGCYIGAAF